MRQKIFWVLINKELTEQFRSGRLIILLAVFLFFGIASPLTAKFMPDIIRSIMKDQNITIQMPEGTWQDAIGQFVKNISQLGVFILIILSMGSVAKEKENGTVSFLLVKPVSRNLFILSKFFSQFIVLFASMALGLVVAALYIKLFFSVLPFELFIMISMVLLLYLSVIQSVTIFFSIVIKNQIPAGILAFVTYILLGLASMLGKAGIYSPSHLIEESQSLLKTSALNWQPFAGSAVIILCCICFGLWVFRKWES